MKKQLLFLLVIGLYLVFTRPVLAQVYHFQEGFVTNAPPVGWLTTNVTYSTTHNNGLYDGTYSVKLKPCFRQIFSIKMHIVVIQHYAIE